MLHHCIVIDDFYPNPDEIHFIANTLETEDESAGNYSGIMTKYAFYQDEHKKIFHHLTGQLLSPATGLNGKFRFSMEDEKGKQHIHFDPGMNTQWAGVVYLQKPEHYEKENEYGTYFWKHKDKKIASIPLNQQGIEAYGWNNVEDLRNFLETDGLDESLWENTLYVPYRYNRLVMFRPWMFHSPGKNFGNKKENCRLIQTFFLG